MAARQNSGMDRPRGDPGVWIALDHRQFGGMDRAFTFWLEAIYT